MLTAISTELESRGIYTVTRGNSIQTVSASEYLEALASEVTARDSGKSQESWLSRMWAFVKRQARVIAGGGFLFTTWYLSMKAQARQIAAQLEHNLRVDYNTFLRHERQFGREAAKRAAEVGIQESMGIAERARAAARVDFILGCVGIVALVLGAMAVVERQHDYKKNRDAKKLARARERRAKVQALHSEFKSLAAKAKAKAGKAG